MDFDLENIVTETELKFGDGDSAHILSGYGAVFNNVDSHGDVIRPGAFLKTLSDHKARGTWPAMFVEHSKYVGGDPLPVGRWIDIAEDGHGLAVKGELIPRDTDLTKRIAGLIEAKVLRSLSIAFQPQQGGAVFGKSAEEPRRTLTGINLASIDIVREPSNPKAGILAFKTLLQNVDGVAASQAIASALRTFAETMTGGDAPTAAERADLLASLQTAHQALTGVPMPAGMKAMPTSFDEFLSGLHWMWPDWRNSKARAVATHGFLTGLDPRDEEARAATRAATQAAVEEIGTTLAGFSLPKL